jgi:hypothetical protein
MRTLTDHIVSGDQSHQLRIEVLDEPGSGGANHLYQIDGYDATQNPSRDGDDIPRTYTSILFQNGGIKEAGVNGLSHESLLAILIDRLQCFMNGPFPSQETAVALTHCKDALTALQQRTIARIKRGVEGTTQA